MNGALKYLDQIAEALENMADKGTFGSSSSSSSNATTIAGNISISGTISAPGVGESLDKALFTDETQEGENVRVSAVRAFADTILGELRAALFSESQGTLRSYFDHIHASLVSLQNYRNLNSLSDVQFASDTPQPRDFLVCGQNAIWTNVTYQNALIALVGSSAIGAYNNSGSTVNTKPIYWNGSQFVAMTLGTASRSDVKGTTDAIANYSSWIPNGNAVWNYLNTHYASFYDKAIANENSFNNASNGDIATAGGVKTFVDAQGFLSGGAITEGSNINGQANGFPTGAAVWEFFNSNFQNNYITGFTWTGGTTYGPTATITRTGLEALAVGAIPAASGESGELASGIVTTGIQSFAGAKTFKANLATDGTFTAASHIISTAGRIDGRMLVVPTDAPSSYETGKWYVHINPNAISGSSPS